MKLVYLWSVLVVLVAVCEAQSDYCRISNRHTMCQFQGLGRQCGGRGPLDRGLSENEKRALVSAHNQLRARVASGSESRGRPGRQPPAADMMEMTWDDELATVAQRWADQCNFGHDSERRVSRFSVGQNVAIRKHSNRQPKGEENRKMVQAWYDEVDLFSRNGVGSFRFESSTGHYTQVVWAKTHKVGCGVTVFQDGRFFSTYLVCNYGPAGNVRGEPIYTQGRACSACPSGTSCTSQGLCRGSPSSGASPPPRSQPQQPSQTNQRPNNNFNNFDDSDEFEDFFSDFFNDFDFDGAQVLRPERPNNFQEQFFSSNSFNSFF